MVTFKSPTDPDLQAMVLEINRLYIPYIKQGLKPQLQSVLGIIEGFMADRSPGRRLHLTFSTERISMRPAVSIKAQEFFGDVQINYKTCMFVLNAANPDEVA